MNAEHKACVFCEILDGASPCYKVAENESSICILDINPFTEGHCLVIPRRHVPWWHEMTAEETAGFYDLARTVAGRLMEIYHPDFICQYARGRRIPHTHLFLVPSYAGDPLDRYFNALEGFQEAPKQLAEIATPTLLKQASEKLRLK